MSIDAATLQQVRAAPLFASLQDSQLGCIAAGEVVSLPAGTVLAARLGALKRIAGARFLTLAVFSHNKRDSTSSPSGQP